MIDDRTSRTSLFFLAVALAWGASASGPLDYEARFWFEHSAGSDVERLIAGRLGILDLGQDPAMLWVAYRHLSGVGVETGSRAVVTGALVVPPREGTWQDDPLPRWLAERKRVPGAAERTWLATERGFERVEATYTWTDYRSNCLEDAFSTATRTLAARIAEHGAESEAVREWLAGQDAVFDLCQKGEEPPPLLGDPWPAWLRRDREYQVAAGHFYAFHHEEALRRFEQIARDRESPWREITRYLVARTALRAGDTERAKAAIADVLGDPVLASLHGAAKRLASLIAVRTRPVERRAELGAVLLEPTFTRRDPDELRQELTDFLWLSGLEGSRPRVGPPGGDLERWLIAMSRHEPSSEEAAVPPISAVVFWREQKSLPWLVAALAASTGTEPEVPELLAAAAKVPAESPAALTVGFHRARLLFAQNEPAADIEARQLLDELLRRDDLDRGPQNRLRQLRAALAPTLDDYLAFSLLRPVELGHYDGSQIWGDDEAPKDPPLLTDEALAHLNRSVSTRERARLAGAAALLPEDWRRRIGLAAWVGAFLEGDGELGKTLVPVLKPLVPESLGTELAAWSALPTGSERDFAASLTMLRYPGLSPTIGENVGRRTPLDEMNGLRDNGWCEKAGLAGSVGLEPVRFLSREARLAAAQEGPWPELAPTVPRLAPGVFAYAELHRDDPRVPEALHRLVRFTRFGCGWGDEIGKISKRAFELLHRRYPKSEWAKKTPYWFNG